MILSIITATYNSEKFIGECLASTINICGENKDVEHIVFDGKSEDNTIEIASTFHHIKILQSNGDKGVYDAFNKSVPFAKGKYILFLNSDDIFHCNNEKELVQLLGKLDNTWLSGFINFINQDGILLKKDRIKRKLNFYRFLISNTIRHPATFVKRTYLLENKFDLKYTYAADYAFFLELWSKGNNPYVIPSIISSFRIWQNSLSSNFEESVRDEFLVRKDWREKSNAPMLFKLVDKLVFHLRLLKLKL